LNGQNFVTDSKEEIREYFDSLQVKYSIDPAGHGLEWLHFKDGEINVSYYFYEDTYTLYSMLFSEAGLKESINMLDSSFEKVNENKWREFDGQQVYIWSLGKLEQEY
jgi:hypothetical protein